MNNTLLKKFFNFGFLIIVMAVFIIRGFKVINRLSPTYDEPVHLIQGYAYLKTGSMDIIYLDDHPVLAKILSAIPLMFLKPQPVLYTNHIYWQNRQRYLFANLMLYYNNYSAEKLLNFGRKMMIILSALFVIPFYIIISKNINKTSAMIACLLYCFNTSIAAHSCLITQDMIASIFYFLCIYGFLKYIITKNVIEMLICSLFTGVMMVTKYSVVVLLFTYVVLLSYFWYKKIIKFNEILKFCIFIISGIVIVGMIVYNVNFLDLFYGLEKVIYLTQQGRSTYFFGKFSTKGFLLYFPILFCLKTELPLLLVFIMSVVKFFHDVVKKKDTIEDTIVFVSIFIYIIISSFSKMQIGHRHLLPVYPLIIWQSCKLATFKKIRTIYYLIIIWNAFVSAKAYPWYISYFNEIIGGSENGWKYYTDSNIDWGQGLKELSIWIKKNPYAKKGIYFSYFGVGDPEYYGIVYRPIGFISNLTYEERQGSNIVKNNFDRIILAVSVTNLQSTYYSDKTVFNFLKNLKPVVVCAYSIFVYDLTEDKLAITKFVELLEKLGYYEDVEYIKSKFL